MKIIVFCLVDEIEVKKNFPVRFNWKKFSIDSGLNWNQEKQVSSKYQGSTTNWATKPYVGSEAKFNMINIKKKNKNSRNIVEILLCFDSPAPSYRETGPHCHEF